MAAKKTSAKATQAKKTASKKTIAKKPEPAKKAASVKKPTASAARKATPAKSPAKPAPKTRTSQTSSVTQQKTAKAIASAEATVKAAQNEASVQSTEDLEEALPEVPEPRVSIPAANLAARTPDPDADSDEGDEGPSSSLLAGPRNVKPYIPRRGEQYMSKEQLEHFRQILLNWKRDLMEEVDRTMLHMKDEAANFPDPNDRATQESEFSLELRTRDRERKLIRKIDEALKRIEDGTYGYCLETGEEIGIKRLEARPVATLCVEAQERRERLEKQYGDRDDRYR
jgi:DnaK suppressor protein